MVEQAIREAVQGTPAAGVMVSSDIVSGVTPINHGLGRQPIGWLIADLDDAALIYRDSWDASKLYIYSSTACSAKFWVW